MAESHASRPHRAGPALDRFVGLGYFFLLVSVVDLGYDVTTNLRGAFAPIGGGVSPGTGMLALLLVGAVAVLGLYFRRTWGLVGSVLVFGTYSMLTLYADELTVAGVAALCVLYLLSRADVVLEAEASAR